MQRPTGWPQTDKRMSPTWRAPHLRREKLNLVVGQPLWVQDSSLSGLHWQRTSLSWHYWQECRLQDHIESKISICLDNVNYNYLCLVNINHDHLSLAVFHQRDRNWPVSKAGLLQALNDDRLCVRTSEKDSLIISTFFTLTFDISTTSIGDKTFATKSPSKD